jgi:hypothetical protein
MGILLALFVVCGGIGAIGGYMIYRAAEEAQHQALLAAANHNAPAPPMDPNAANVPAVKLELHEGGVVQHANVLTPNDPKFTNKPFKAFEVNFEQGKTYQIDMVSTQIDSFLRLYGPNNEPIASNDDSGGNLNSRIVFTANATGAHKIHATVFGALQPGRAGNFALTVRKLAD